MASTPAYHVQHLVDNKQAFSYHRSVRATWEEKWKQAAHVGRYPFSDGKGEDFDTIFENLIQESNDDTAVFFDPERYAKPFLPVGESLVKQAEEAEQAKDFTKACELYLRAGAVYRMARFPVIRSPLGQKAWDLGKAAYLKAGQYLPSTIAEVRMPFTHASAEQGESKDATIGGFLRFPGNGAKKPEKGWPLVLFICGLDAYRTDHSSSPGGKLYQHLNNGQALLMVDIPGTADSPAARGDAKSPDRLWSSVFDWIDAHKDIYGFDTSRIAARGISTGGYYAMRIAHTHADRLKAVVAEGGGSHHMFDTEWIKAQDHMEYPFALAEGLADKFGYPDVESYVNDNPRAKFSLLENGIFDMPSTRLLLVNGMEDSIFPIEDSIIPLRHGRVKDARFVDGRGHMGAPEGEGILRDWLLGVL